MPLADEENLFVLHRPWADVDDLFCTEWLLGSQTVSELHRKRALRIPELQAIARDPTLL